MSPPIIRGSSPLIAFCVLALAGPRSAAAQAHAHGAPALRAHVGASLIGLVTRADPALAGEPLAEGYVTRPVLAGMAAWRGLGATATLNLEGLTLDRGELNAGISGEGYIDRRHPHTYLHEAVGTARASYGPWSGSLAAGRGFAPFGTDDPMVRPFVKYPANHHLAQILERWIAIGAVRNGPVLVEAGLFNGDEPTGPGSLGRLSRFGDSWAARLTLLPARGIELQASHARIASPEHATGGGLDQRKWSAAARTDVVLGGAPVYGLVEWGRTDEYSRGRRAFSFGTTLAEAAVDLRGWTLAARLERTTRAEEERLENAFRSARPHADENVVGVTRWRSATLYLGFAAAAGPVRLVPFAEVSRLDAEEITGSVFDPAEFYGERGQWSLSAGLRVGAGLRHGRMGRYGVALPGT